MNPKPSKRRPRLFIGSSSESLAVAMAIQANLDDDAEVTVWSQGIFQLADTAIGALVRALGRTDFAVFVFAPTDVLRFRQKKHAAVRDNVIFELGLFVGKLGERRNFVAVPKDADFHVPTDLTGVMFGSYEPKRRDTNVRAALGPFCEEVRTRMKRMGPVARRKEQREVMTVPAPTAAQSAKSLDTIGSAVKTAMNPEPLEILRDAVHWVQETCDWYFENRLWPEALLRAQRDASGISHRDPAGSLRADAITKASDAARRYGLLGEWERWFLDRFANS